MNDRSPWKVNVCGRAVDVQQELNRGNPVQFRCVLEVIGYLFVAVSRSKVTGTGVPALC